MMKKNIWAILALSVIVVFSGCIGQRPEGIPAGNPKSTTATPTTTATTPAVSTATQTPANASSKELAVIETDFGRIVFEFLPDKAPGHVENFKKLARSGFYNGTTFHRVIPGFMIQGGDPNSKDDDRSNDGTGGPGYTINAEFNDVAHVRGIVSMARAADPNSAGSQFFIVVADSRFLDGKYTVFGRVIDGMDVVDKIVNVPTDANDNPLTKVVMRGVTIQSASPRSTALVNLPPQQLLLTADQFPLPGYSVTKDEASGQNGWYREFRSTGTSGDYGWVSVSVFRSDALPAAFGSASDLCSPSNAGTLEVPASVRAVEAPVVGDYAIACKFIFKGASP